MLAGAQLLVAIDEWVADAPVEVLAALGLRADPWMSLQPPGDATVRRMLARVDGDALDAAIGGRLLRVNPPTPAPAIEGRLTLEDLGAPPRTPTLLRDADEEIRLSSAGSVLNGSRC
ncbi:hypothetical protein ABZ807_25010 [Micromonospora sp. NPDC047548]|uniref:hypothetical protein n=1 Tax=Micromonospora sp. NPDC047548 TaxID=3155624 RepID=UPI0033F074E3